MTDRTEAMDNLIAQDADLIEICPDDLVQRLRDLAEEWFEMCDDIHEPLYEAADRIEALISDNSKLAAGSCDVEGGKVGDEYGHFYCTLQNKVEAQAAEIERLKNKLSVETEPSPYCPICGSCGDEGCCGSKRCMYPAALEQSKW